MNKIILLLLPIIFSSCATEPRYAAPEPDYVQKKEKRERLTSYTKSFQGSFSHMKIGQNLYQVSFTGHSRAPQPYVLEAIIQQSAFFAHNENYPYFTMAENVIFSEVNGNHSGIATIRMLKEPNQGKVAYNTAIILKQIMNDEKAELERINAEIDRENRVADRVNKNIDEHNKSLEKTYNRMTASSSGIKNCSQSNECGEGETCKIYYTNDGSFGQCGKFGIWGKLFNP